MRWSKLLSIALCASLWSSVVLAQVVVSTHDYNRRCVPLGNTVSSTIIDIDATCSASVLNTQAVNNLELTPADSVAFTSYLVDVGNQNTSGTDDPTFTGTIGDTGAYYSTDGADFFELNLASGSMPDFLKNLAKTTGGTNFWFGTTFYHQTAAATKALGGNSGSTSLPGIFITINSSEQLVFAQRGDSATVTNTLTSPTLANNTWYTVLISYSTGGNVRFWVNATTAAATQAMTFNTTTTNPNASMRFFASAGNRAGANMRWKWSGMGNTYLDDTEAAKIFAALEARHDQFYTEQAAFNLSPWKLTLPVNSSGVLSGTNDAAEILPSTDGDWSSGDPDLLTYEHATYFNRGSGYFEFASPNYGAYTSTAGDARSELRHLTDYGPTETLHAKFSFYVQSMANNAKANIGQIHRLDADPVFKLTYTSKSDGSGTYRALLKKTDGAADFSFDIGLGDKVLLDSITNGDVITVEYEFDPVAQTLKFWINDSPTPTASITGVQSSGFDSYHKIGMYTNDPGDGTINDLMSVRVTSWENLAP